MLNTLLRTVDYSLSVYNFTTVTLMHMKSIFFFLFVSITYTINLYSNNKDDSSIHKHLDILNKYLDNKSIYEEKKDERINILLTKLKIKNLALEQRYTLTAILQDEYSTYKSDSMYIYALKMINLADQMQDKDKKVKSQIALANSYLWAGLFKDAYEYSSNIDTLHTQKDTQIDYLRLLFSIEFECCLYGRSQKGLVKIYAQKISKIRSKVEKELPPHDRRLQDLKMRELLLLGKLQEAFDLVSLPTNEDEPQENQINRLSSIGYVALEKGDTITAIEYLARASVIDIKMGSRHTPALRMLSQALYSKGYLDEAYRYIQRTMDNAFFFGSRYRIYEASTVLPIIDKDFYIKTKNRKDNLTLSLVITAFFLVTLLLFIIIISKQNKKLKESKLLIKKQNSSLVKVNNSMELINKDLQEANNIKEAYLGEVLSYSSVSISKIEELTKIITRKIKAKQYDDILNFIIKNQYEKERINLLIFFDKIFLKLYPDFIHKFNSLLNDESKIDIQQNETLTPELRIFALIRLGIVKNEVISEILNYSISTVKNYKTKIRNNSIVPNDKFEEYLMSIEPKTED